VRPTLCPRMIDHGGFRDRCERNTGLSMGSLIPLVMNSHPGDCGIQQQRKVSAPLLRCSPWRMYSCGDHLATGKMVKQ
jgi:hypothetical protein